MEEEKYLGRICVAFREGKEVEIIVSDVEVLSRLSAYASQYMGLPIH